MHLPLHKHGNQSRSVSFFAKDDRGESGEIIAVSGLGGEKSLDGLDLVPQLELEISEVMEEPFGCQPGVLAKLSQGHAAGRQRQDEKEKKKSNGPSPEKTRLRLASGGVLQLKLIMPRMRMKIKGRF